MPAGGRKASKPLLNSIYTDTLYDQQGLNIICLNTWSTENALVSALYCQVLMDWGDWQQDYG